MKKRAAPLFLAVLTACALACPALAAEVDKVAETAGYLWQKGWPERNGGNKTKPPPPYFTQ